MVLDLAHFERRGMPVAQEVIDETRVGTKRSRAFAIGDARRLDDGGITAHVVDDPHEPVIENRESLVEDFLETGGHDAPRLVGLGPLRRDLLSLFGTERHDVSLFLACRPPHFNVRPCP